MTPPGLAGLLPDLAWRGMLHVTTPGLPARLANGRSIAGYIGFDPSGASLHVGHLVPIFGLIRLQQFGGKPIAVVGGGTGMIGDPSGRSSERNLLDRETLEANVVGIRAQLERFLEFGSGEGGAELVNNLDWLSRIGLIEFLRDTGKHFTVPYMLAKDSVQVRLERGLSFTEFSYMLLQAADFEHLYRTRGVELQMGGADQWGNITAGLELIRRTSGRTGVDVTNEVLRASDYLAAEARGEALPGPAASVDPAHGLAYPLLLSPSGTKFGKSEAGDSVWLDAERTSPYAFYQYWITTDDRDVGTYLRWFTTLERAEVEALDAAVAERPDRREGQRALARDVTVRVHGAAAADLAARVSEAAFSQEPLRDPEVLATLHAATDGFTFGEADVADGLVRLLVAAEVFASNGEARRMISGGGLTVNDERVTDTDAAVPPPIDGEWLVVRIGRRRVQVGRLVR